MYQCLQSTNPLTAIALFLVLSLITPISDTIAAETASDMSLEEIVVTARRQEENLQEVPLAVSVLSGEDLLEQGGLKIDTIGKMAPNVHFEAAGGTSGVKSPVIFIRGMGQADFIPVEDPAVGIYLDGVFMGRNIGSVFDLIDIERIEVLRGPQGTLFGRNTIGGAINIVSKRPVDEFGGTIRVSAGDEGYLEINGTVNIPISEKVSARLSGFSRERDGYVDAIQYDDLQIGNDDIWGLRAVIRADVSDNFSIDASFDYSEADEAPGAISPVRGIGGFNGSNIPVMGLPDQAFVFFHNTIYSGDPASCNSAVGQATNKACYGSVWNTGDPYKINSVYVDNDGNKVEPEQSVEVMGGNITMTWDIGDMTLKSITSHREFDISLFNDLDFSPFILFANNHDEYSQDQQSQEFQLTGEAMGGRVDYVLGLFYFREKGREAIFNQITFAPPLSGPPSFFFQYLDRYIDNDSQAVFGQANIDLTESLTLTVGARYTESNKDFQLDTRRRVGPLSEQGGKLTTTETTPMASLAWNIKDDMMLYASYSEGYRDGSYAARFTGAVPDPLPNYEPEYVTNYELGIKSTIWDGRMRLNASAFVMDYEDMQIAASSDAVTTSSTKENLGDATLRGLEVEMTALITESFSINVNIGVLDDEIDSLLGTLVSNTIVIGKDNDLAMTPDYTLSIMAKYERQLTNGGAISLRADYSMKDDYYTRAENMPENLIDDYENLNLNATYYSVDNSWSATLGMRNATDAEYYQSATSFSSFGEVFGQPVRPRTVYATLQYNFGN
tara:strand:+ start:721 stop:3072 length:2352 start_codon:yes stop_codon:yes gene_type:complete